MNRITRTLTHLTIATGLATAALSVGATAYAGPPMPGPGPVIVMPPSDPGPKGPGDIQAPTPGPVDPTDGPDDIKAPAPKPQPPKGPKDLSNGDSDPVVDPKPEEPSEDTPAKPGAKNDKPAATDVDVPVPGTEAPAVDTTTTTTGTADAPVAESSTVASQHGEDNGYLLWLLAGLGAAGATGIVVIAARRRKAADEA